MTKITKRAVDALKKGDVDVFLWDSELRGFGARLKPSGALSYIVQYRNRYGRSRRLTVASHGRQTPEQARKEAKQLLALVEKGEDPAAERSTLRAGATVAELCDRFLEDHARQHKKASSAAEDARNIKNHVKPLLGSLKAVEVTRADIDRFKRAVRDGKTARVETLGPRRKVIVRGGATAANRCLALLSTIFNIAEKWGVRPDASNPCRHVEKYREHKSERYLSAAELVALGTTLSQIETEAVEPASVIAAIRLLLFTGCRLSEILTLRWDWVDFDTGCLRLPDSKTGAKVVYVPAPALTVLSGLKRQGGNPFVIVGDRRGKDADEPGEHLVNLQKPWRRIRERATLALWRASDDPRAPELIARLEREHERTPTLAEVGAAADFELPPGMNDVRLHDLRHSFASVAVASGEGLHMIGKLLGHTQAQTTHRYAHLAADPMKAAAERVANTIAATMANGGGEVVAIDQFRQRK